MAGYKQSKEALTSLRDEGPSARLQRLCGTYCIAC